MREGYTGGTTEEEGDAPAMPFTIISLYSESNGLSSFRTSRA